MFKSHPDSPSVEFTEQDLPVTYSVPQKRFATQTSKLLKVQGCYRITVCPCTICSHCSQEMLRPKRLKEQRQKVPYVKKEMTKLKNTEGKEQNCSLEQFCTGIDLEILMPK